MCFADEELATQQWWKGDGSGVGNVGEYDPQTGKVKYVETHKLGRKMGTVQPSSDVEEGEGGDEDMDVADEMGDDGDDDEDSDQDGFDIDVDDRELEEEGDEEEVDEVGDSDVGVEAGERSNSADGFKDVVEGMDNFERTKKGPVSGGKAVNYKFGEKKVAEEGGSVHNGAGGFVNSEKQPDLIARGQQQARTRLDDAKATENMGSSSLTVPKWVLEPRMNSKMASGDGHNGMSDILEGVALEDLVKSLEKKKKGSFYWDHALGVRKTILENPLQGGSGELSGGGLMKNVGTVRNSLRGFKEVVEDWKERFNSDDELVDENVQRRLEDVKEIEDALQLNSDAGSFNKAVSSRSTSKKLESQPKKVRLGTFDPMNPANIPMLQDPDTSPGTWMTKSDKEMLRAIRVDSLNVGGQLPPKAHLRGYTPNAQGKTAPAKFSADVVGTALEKENHQDNQIMGKQDSKLGTRSSKGEGIGRKVGGVEQGRRKTPQAFKAPPLAQPAPKQIRSKVANPLALNSGVKDSQVSSLEVLDQFLVQGSCSLKVFMAWTTPGWGFTARHLRVLESLFRFHPNACVVILSETIDIDYFKTFLKEG